MSALITRASISSVTPGRVAARAPASVAALRAAVWESDWTVGARIDVGWRASPRRSPAAAPRRGIRARPSAPGSPRRRPPGPRREAARRSPGWPGWRSPARPRPSRTARQSRITALTARSRSLIGRQPRGWPANGAHPVHRALTSGTFGAGRLPVRGKGSAATGGDRGRGSLRGAGAAGLGRWRQGVSRRGDGGRGHGALGDPLGSRQAPRRLRPASPPLERTSAVAAVGSDLRARKATTTPSSSRSGTSGPTTAYSYRFCRSGHRCSATGKFETAPRAIDPTDDPLRLLGRRDRPSPSPGERDTRSSATSRPSRRWPPRTTTSTSTSATRSTPTPRFPALAAALTVKEKWAHVPEEALDREHADDPRSRPASTTTGTTTSSSTTSRSPRTGGSSTTAACAPSATTCRSPTAARTGIYRTFRWGKNLELFFLDERSFRSAKASANGVCDNPDTGAARPRAHRSADRSATCSAPLIPSLVRRRVSQACKNKINSPNRTFLGRHQLAPVHERRSSTRPRPGRWS